MFYDEDMKKKAKRVNFIEYLKKYHPDCVQWKLSGYVYKKEPYVAFFQGRDGEYRYYDNIKAKRDGVAYCGDGMKFLTATMEVEAESVAFVVCNHFGLDTSDYSFGYLAGWSSSRELPELKSSLQTIQKTAHDLIDRMEEEMLHLSKRMECSENLDATRLSHVEASNIRHHRR